jgi:adenylate kinase
MMKTNSPLVVILLGSPGSGKSTQASRLSQKYHIPHISMGRALRKIAISGSKLAQKVNFYLNRGELVPDQVIDEALRHILNQIDLSKGIIFEGVPRSLDQLKIFDQILADYKLNAPIVFNIVIADRLVWQRIQNRAKRPGTDIRHDESREQVLKRLEWTKIETAPLINEYKRRKQLITVNGEESMNQVEESISQVLDKIEDALCQNSSRPNQEGIKEYNRL